MRLDSATADGGGGGGVADLKTSTSGTRAAVKALRVDIRPGTDKAGSHADEGSAAVVREFNGWDTGAGLKEAHAARVLRGASDSDRNFALLYEAERAQAAQDLANAPDSPGRGTENWDIRARDAGMGIGTFNAIGSDVILDDRDARKGWADDVAKYTPTPAVRPSRSSPESATRRSAYWTARPTSGRRT
ncbi:hypothetical protein [Streptomyces sp. NPDC048710]|uniref:hypothetical protein n=1 Tax=Streptomyces sp. NPDC048710 TaxID=3365586 RepID=UPI00372159FA